MNCLPKEYSLMQNYVKVYFLKCVIGDFASLPHPLRRRVRWRGPNFHSENEEELALMGCLVTFIFEYFRAPKCNSCPFKFFILFPFSPSPPTSCCSASGISLLIKPARDRNATENFFSLFSYAGNFFIRFLDTKTQLTLMNL